MSRTALLIEDNQSHVELIRDEIEALLGDWQIDVVATVAEARRRITGQGYGLFLIDFRLPDGDGIQLLREIRAAGIDTPTVFVSTAASAKLAVEAMKLGADDYVVKEEGYLATLPFLVRDVLERRRLADERRGLEERLQRAERAATLGYLASGLAHHINNPLATIRTFLQLLPAHRDDPGYLTQYLEMALGESERIRDLVKDIMRAATVPAEGQELQRLDVILTRAEEAVAGEIKAKGLVCRKELPVNVPLVRVHGEAATCLFLTLLQNAVRFSPEGGAIEVRARVDDETGRLVTVVRDHGPGIPVENREKIFEPFFTTAVDGLGMGLFVASRIADLQNIELSVESCEPGAAFRVGLPLAAPAVARAAASTLPG